MCVLNELFITLLYMLAKQSIVLSSDPRRVCQCVSPYVSAQRNLKNCWSEIDATLQERVLPWILEVTIFGFDLDLWPWGFFFIKSEFCCLKSMAARRVYASPVTRGLIWFLVTMPVI